MSDIKTLDGFVKKYPDSERVPEAWLAAASICLEGLNEQSEVPTLQIKRLGKTYISKIEQLYPAFAEKDAQFHDLKSQYQFFAELYWTLEPRLAKTAFRVGEPIPLTLVLHNINDSAQTFTRQLGEGLPLIKIGLTYEYAGECAPIRETPPFQVSSTYKQEPNVQPVFAMIPARGQKTWTFDLRSMPQAFINTFGKMGVYDLSRPGTYYLQVELSQYQYGISSPVVSFTVK